MVYKRVKGGEKNLKTGTVWSKKELLEVYHIYRKLGGTGLHENNPKIQELASKLGRTVRSTEAQTIMFRSLERNEDYGHSNMNKLCKEIWKEMGNKIESNVIREFPQGLLEWAGHKLGGVKKPFDDASGRPNGKVIETRLTNKLLDWTKTIGNDETPNAVLLVGGPGNGKTDALEYLISELDSRFGSDLFSEIAGKIHNSNELIPRKVKIDLPNSFDLKYKHITIVQDASTGDKNLSSEECLLNDLDSLIDGSGIYIACINRGVLAEALTLARERESLGFTILSRITKALSAKIEQKSLWPLHFEEEDIFESSIGVWPMDVESLVDHTDGVSPAGAIFSEAVNESKWKCIDCSLDKDKCPFYQNKLALQDEQKLKGLIKTLRDFEIINSKRWSFRELFSLVSYLIVGSEHDFNDLDPCKWYEKKFIELQSDSKKSHVRAIMELNDHLYHFRLYSSWPTFSHISRTGKFKSPLGESDYAKELFLYFTHVRARKGRHVDISKTLDYQVGPMTDPVLLNSKNGNISNLPFELNELESLFSFSVDVGFRKVKKYMNPIEKEFFLLLKTIENELDEKVRLSSSVSNLLVDKLLEVTRGIGLRYFKRIYFSTQGITKDHRYLEDFIGLSSSIDVTLKSLKVVKNKFEDLIQDNKGLKLSINSSFAQPETDFNDRVTLKVNKVGLKYRYVISKLDDVPRDELAILSLDSGENPYLIPITYTMYKAITLRGDGAKPSSLPVEVTAMLDNIKSKLAGFIIRDARSLRNSSLSVSLSERSYRIDDPEQIYDIEKE